MEILLRKAEIEDREKIIDVESKATPNLNYVSHVFDMYVSDEIGEFSVAEVAGEIVACGKFTVVPDGSAWLETLRVIPEHQGMGIGKRFYERFFDTARNQGIKTMRMYTGVNNVVSKGLAERYGFQQVATFRGARLPCQSYKTMDSSNSFNRVKDPKRAVELLMHYRDKWNDFLVMNRTFYSLNPPLCKYLAKKGQVYEDPTNNSVIALGARFMPKQALHIGAYGGNEDICLEFAMKKGVTQKVENLSCLFPSSAISTENTLKKFGFQLEKSDFIVMEVKVKK
jgi:N-acetylglutamate synthase-like GNAT family acetyltransferase